MEEGRHSAMAEGCAALWAMHQRTAAEPRILDDPVSARLVDADGPVYKAVLEFLEGLPPAKRLRVTHHLSRTRYAEDCLAEAFAGGLRQYVILGAGLETFAYRQPDWAEDLRIFEVDHPSTQQWKRRRLRDGAITIPENTTFVPVDFEKSTVKSALLEAGLDPIAPAFLSMLGVSQYLTEEALDETLDMVRVMVPSSQIVFSFVLRDGDLPEDEAAWARENAEFCAAKGEPWLTRLGPDQLRLKLLKMGFSKVSHLSSEQADQLYFRGRLDGLRVCSIEQMMRAIV